jgi:hypothetical protein
MLALTDSALAPALPSAPRPPGPIRGLELARLPAATAAPKRSCSRTASVEQVVDLCIARLARATPERIVAGGRTVEVARVKITGEALVEENRVVCRWVVRNNRVKLGAHILSAKLG